MSVAIIVPVLGRPANVEPLLQSIRRSTPGPYRVLFVCTPGDNDEIRAIEAAGADHVLTGARVARGDYARKINLGYRATIDPLLFLAADDLRFLPGWFEAATAQLRPGIGVVGTNDLGNRRVMAGNHSTHSLVTRAYVDTYGTIDEPGKVLHEGYPHEWVDDEFIATARRRHAFTFAADSLVEHLHPLWGKAASDDLYAKHRERMREGRRLFLRRRRLWA